MWHLKIRDSVCPHLLLQLFCKPPFLGGWQLFSNLSYFSAVLHFPSMLQGPGRCLLCLSDVMLFCYKNFSVLVQEVHWTACCWGCCYGSTCFLNCSHSINFFSHVFFFYHELDCYHKYQNVFFCFCRLIIRLNCFL